MRKNHRDNRRKSRAGINAGTVPPACTAEHRKAMRDGLSILARVIARTHLQRPQMESDLGKRPLARHQNQRAGGEQSPKGPTPPADPSGSFYESIG